MPLFEFQCEDCNQPFEELVFGSAVDDVVCPQCGSSEVNKMISTFASRISGGGAPSFNSGSAGACNTGSV